MLEGGGGGGGNTSPVCRSMVNKFSRGPTKNARWLSTDDQNELLYLGGQDESLHVIKDHSLSPYKVKIHVNGHLLTMEVDTGPGVSLITESELASLLPL